MEKLKQSVMNQRRSGSLASEHAPSRPKDWSALLAPDAPVASEDFMEAVEDLPLQERAFLAVSQERSISGEARRRRRKSE